MTTPLLIAIGILVIIIIILGVWFYIRAEDISQYREGLLAQDPYNATVSTYRDTVKDDQGMSVNDYIFERHVLGGLEVPNTYEMNASR